MFDKLKTVEKRYNDLNDLLSDPKIIAQQSEFQKYAKEQSDLIPIVNKFQDLKKYVKQLKESKKISMDCKKEDILILEYMQENNYSDEKKLLKSLGYIK